MNKFFLNIILSILNLKFISSEQGDNFEISKNIKFCGADLLSQNIKYPLQKGVKRNKRSLITPEYKPIRIFVETTYFEYQGNLNSELKNIVPIIKTALNQAIEGIKGLIEVVPNDDTDYYKDVFKSLFDTYNVTKWDPIFDNNIIDIKSDF